jgi:transposase InsO family protein
MKRSAKRPRLRNWDRLFWILLSRFWGNWQEPLIFVKPETVIRWHRKGFKLFWKFKSRRKGSGRPPISAEIRDLVLKMVSIDFFAVPTAKFRILFVLVILSHSRRKVVHFNVTSNSTAKWTAQQIVNAFPWDTAPKYLLRDRDSIYGAYFRQRVKNMGIKEVITAPRSPWQNPFVERLIGSIRRDCLDHVIVLNESHLERILISYFQYYHYDRTHYGLGKDTPVERPVQSKPAKGAKVIELPRVGGLHHRYEWKEAA